MNGIEQRVREGILTITFRHILDEKGHTKEVERSIFSDGAIIYSDRLSFRMFCYRLEHPDLLTALQQLGSGEGGLYIGDHTTCRCKKRNYLIELFHLIRFQLKAQKLNFGIKLFKFCHKYKLLGFKTTP